MRNTSMPKRLSILFHIIPSHVVLGAWISAFIYLLCEIAELGLPLIYGILLEQLLKNEVDLLIWSTWIFIGCALILIQKASLYKNTEYREKIREAIIIFFYHAQKDIHASSSESNDYTYIKNEILQLSEKSLALFDVESMKSIIYSISFLVIILIIASIDFFSALMTILLGLVAIFAHRVGNSLYKKTGVAVQNQKIKYFSDTEDTLKSVDMICLFNAQQQEINRYRLVLHNVLKREISQDVTRFSVFFIGLEICKTSYSIGMITRALFLAATGQFLLPYAVELILYSQKATEPIHYLNYVIKQWQEGITALETLLNKVNQLRLQRDCQMTESKFNEIRFQDVCFSYADSLIIKNFSQTFLFGQHYCLFGKSGSGKTTIIRMITGELKPSNGTILIDGNAISESLQFPTLLQDSIIFNVSLSENISFQYPPDEKTKSLINIMELNYLDQNQIVSEKVSGGEKSRILLARALWHLNQSVILDEPLIGVDEERKIRILLKIKEILNGKFLLLSTHDKTIATMLECIQIPLDSI